jgi:hypothetical protein
MVTVGIASVPDRERLLKRTIDSLKGQADTIYVALNGYKTVPDYFESYDNVKYLLLEENLGDGMKFHWADQVGSSYYLTCDDDLQYPRSYCKDMIWAIERHKCIISLHGKNFKNRPVLSYRKGATEHIHCLMQVDQDKYVDVGGTGVMGFHTDFLKVSSSDFPTNNMADIYLAKVAFEQGVRILAIAHESGYLTYLHPEKTIWNSFSRENDKFQTEVLNSFLK